MYDVREQRGAPSALLDLNSRSSPGAI